MKKIYSLSALLVSVILFMWLYYYDKSFSYNYHVANVIEYFFYWSTALFVLSLLAFVLNNTKYKIWFFVTIPCAILSVLIAYDIDGHDIFFNGEYITFWLISFYSFISIIYFIVQFLKNKKNNSVL